MHTFEHALIEHLESKEKLKGPEKRLLRILRLPPANKRRQRAIGQLEANARVNEDGTLKSGDVDWAAFDFDAFLEFFAKLIELLVKLFGL